MLGLLGWEWTAALVGSHLLHRAPEMKSWGRLLLSTPYCTQRSELVLCPPQGEEKKEVWRSF